MKAMKWDAKLYDADHGFVSDYGRSLEELVPEGAASLLDLGCGTGTLTSELARRVPRVVGVDSSVDMIDEAKAHYPELDLRVADACVLPFDHEFDVVFSNAVFHWIPDHHTLLDNVARALRPGGALICEFGAHGNIAAIETATAEALGRHGFEHTQRFHFPTETEFESNLCQSGFTNISVISYDRPTPLSNGWQGLGHWMRQFFALDFEPLTQDERRMIVDEVENALAERLWDEGQNRWVADYRRLRATATTPTAQ